MSEPGMPTYRPMNPDVKEKWTAALRSGKYAQGKHTLHNPTSDTWCCLGVLCDLAVQEGVIPPATIREHGSRAPQSEWYGTGDDDTRSSAFLPAAVQRWANLTEAADFMAPGPWEGDTTHPWSAPMMNDGRGMTFPEIADMVDRYL